VAEAHAGAQRLQIMRAEMADALSGLGLGVVGGDAPFLLVKFPDSALVRKRLHANNIAVRRCDTFVGLDDGHLRLAVRPEWPILVQAIAEVLR
jgi:histidinol-phosphate aminotransferase